jgi:hypothetical protein
MRSLLGACCLVLGASFASSLQAEELRDPFAFGPRSAQVQRAEATLMGVLWDATHPLAILGEEMVGVDAVVDGWRIIEIKQEGIIVGRDERREFIAPGDSLPTD